MDAVVRMLTDTWDVGFKVGLGTGLAAGAGFAALLLALALVARKP